MLSDKLCKRNFNQFTCFSSNAIQFENSSDWHKIGIIFALSLHFLHSRNSNELKIIINMMLLTVVFVVCFLINDLYNEFYFSWLLVKAKQSEFCSANFISAIGSRYICRFEWNSERRALPFIVVLQEADFDVGSFGIYYSTGSIAIDSAGFDWICEFRLNVSFYVWKFGAVKIKMKQ